MKHIEKCLSLCASREAMLLRDAVDAALRAGAILREFFEQPIGIRRKGEIDLVTEADLMSEKAVIAILRETTPAATILAEESASSYSGVPDGPAWIIDPLDGTTNFAHSYPWFAVSIAYLETGIPILGVIYAPAMDELFYVCRGAGAWLNGRRLLVSGAKTLNESLLATGFPYDIRQHHKKVLAALGKVITRVQGVRRCGSAALDLACVASGRLDGFWEIKLKPWDTAAGQLLVEEAGGTVTDFQGRPYSSFIPEVTATNGIIHSELLGLLAEFGNGPFTR